MMADDLVAFISQFAVSVHSLGSGPFWGGNSQPLAAASTPKGVPDPVSLQEEQRFSRERSLSATPVDAKERTPNVILLLVDDMGYGDIAAHGNPVIKTPNFDALFAQSARFTNFAVSPSCAPTRAALLTGKHEFLSGVTHTVKSMNNMDPKSTTIAQLLQARGYRTAIIGKWHLGHDGPYGPGKRGFDETLNCIDDDYKKSHFNPTLMKNGIKTEFQGYREDIFFNDAIQFVERNKDRPFFLYRRKPPTRSGQSRAGQEDQSHLAELAGEGRTHGLRRFERAGLLRSTEVYAF